ncbi:MAG: GNAT family N-acetyltransferase, partial [Proteobacteria bacterium]|nr:GNAT family N-acetyltransferase [Pseudomonadota bacterium]
GKLSLHKVTGGMYAVNEASRRLFESVGFKPEATFREQALWRGRFIDVYKYGLLAREWFETKKARGD